MEKQELPPQTQAVLMDTCHDYVNSNAIALPECPKPVKTGYSSSRLPRECFIYNKESYQLLDILETSQRKRHIFFLLNVKVLTTGEAFQLELRRDMFKKKLPLAFKWLESDVGERVQFQGSADNEHLIKLEFSRKRDFPKASFIYKDVEWKFDALLDISTDNQHTMFLTFRCISHSHHSNQVFSIPIYNLPSLSPKLFKWLQESNLIDDEVIERMEASNALLSLSLAG